jgi:hypothetical protein
MKMTSHAIARGQQRGIMNDVLQVAYRLGKITNAPGGALIIFFGNKEYNRAIKELKKQIKILERAKGLTLIISDDTLVTTYKN